jgi:hypothetical protein
MAKQDLSLAAYLLAKQIQGTPLDSESIAALKKCATASENARAMMPLGRANVHAETRATDFKSLFLALASRRIAESQLRSGEGRLEQASFAGLTASAGTGACAEYSDTTLYELGKTLVGDDCAARVFDRNVDHNYVVLRTKRQGESEAAIVSVADSWAHGPGGILAEDHRFLPGAVRTALAAGESVFDAVREETKVSVWANVDVGDGAEQAEFFRQGRDELGARRRASIEKLATEIESEQQAKGSLPAGIYTTETPCLSDDFARQTAEALDRLSSSKNGPQELARMAIEVAKALGATADEAQASAEQIVRLTQALSKIGQG